MEKMEQMKAYIEQIRAADKAYYNTGAPVLTDYEYDQMFDALKALEKETGVVLLRFSDTKSRRRGIG